MESRPTRGLAGYCGCIAAGMVLGVAVLAVTAAVLIEFVGFN